MKPRESWQITRESSNTLGTRGSLCANSVLKCRKLRVIRVRDHSSMTCSQVILKWKLVIFAICWPIRIPTPRSSPKFAHFCSASAVFIVRRDNSAASTEAVTAMVVFCVLLHFSVSLGISLVSNAFQQKRPNQFDQHELIYFIIVYKNRKHPTNHPSHTSNKWKLPINSCTCVRLFMATEKK